MAETDASQSPPEEADCRDSAAGPACRDKWPGGRVGVIDIGSNSVRLVIFDGLKRVPLTLFNEKVLCGLGRGLGHSGELAEEARELALRTLERFTGLARAMDVARLDLLATAAVREARNGGAFVADIERRCGHRVTVLSGQEEARLSAQGVLSGMPSAEGVMGDLGGGSLELVALRDSRFEKWATLPLGPLRLIDAVSMDRSAAKTIIDHHLDSVRWLDDMRGQAFYPVGGAWRALARIQMEQSRYPLRMIHGFVSARRDLEAVSRLVSQMGRFSLARIGRLPKRREETLPFAALLMQRLLSRLKPARVVFSAYGLREGWMFDNLPPDEQGRDPLFAAAVEWAEHDGRFGDFGRHIGAWTAPLFAQEEPAERRVRLAACHLSDIGWRYHPDYRAEHVLLRMLRAQELCIEHHERAFIALALCHRYGGGSSDSDIAACRRLLKPRRARAAQLLGRAMRLAYALSGGAHVMLRNTRLSLEDGQLKLYMPADVPVPSGTVLERRLEDVAVALDLSQSAIVVTG